MIDLILDIGVLVWFGFIVYAIWEAFTTPTPYEDWLDEQEDSDD